MLRKSMTLFALIIVAFTICATYCQEINDFDNLVYMKYQKFMGKFNKTYNSLEEMNQRFENFKRNYLQAKMQDLTALKEDNSEKLFGTTQFMDMSEEEFSQHYLNLNMTDIPSDTQHYFNSTNEEGSGRFLQETDKVPAKWDWREHGAVSPVKNQGYCGGCWAFSAVSNMESLHYIKTGKLRTFSEQQLIDCDPYNSGCVGGIMHLAFYYVYYYGVELSQNYPFGWQQGRCMYNSTAPKLEIEGYKSAGTNDEEKIKEMLYKVGPLSVTINARLLQYYYGGVINVSYDQCPYKPNHGVNLVGYGTTAAGLNYWIVRNTWGPNWGEKGYFRIARGRGLCGINQYVVTAVLK